jgi:hypothetical protein
VSAAHRPFGMPKGGFGCVTKDESATRGAAPTATSPCAGPADMRTVGRPQTGHRPAADTRAHATPERCRGPQRAARGPRATGPTADPTSIVAAGAGNLRSPLNRTSASDRLAVRRVGIRCLRDLLHRAGAAPMSSTVRPPYQARLGSGRVTRHPAPARACSPSPSQALLADPAGGPDLCPGRSSPSTGWKTRLKAIYEMSGRCTARTDGEVFSGPEGSGRFTRIRSRARPLSRSRDVMNALPFIPVRLDRIPRVGVVLPICAPHHGVSR